uniref:Syntrophin C-terminal PH domain-containing protein n=1 Tax=Podarcis muralis TaxID=64176 RepID=A0A670IX65_PODMU
KCFKTMMSLFKFTSTFAARHILALPAEQSSLFPYGFSREHSMVYRIVGEYLFLAKSIRPNVSNNIYFLLILQVSTLDWVRAEKTYNLCEVLFKVHKVDYELEDQRPYCFSVVVGHGKSHYFNVELGSDLAVWEKSFQKAIFLEVQRTGVRESLCFTLDFASGFTCLDNKTKNVLWRFKFSQLKGSSDDGKTRVKLLFQNTETKQIETKELEFQDLTAVLNCIHSFIAAKVASVDPLFIDSQSIARKYTYSN